jgi:hypothetical protein
METQIPSSERSVREKAPITKVTFTFKDGSTKEFNSYREAMEAAREDNENR